MLIYFLLFTLIVLIGLTKIKYKYYFIFIILFLFSAIRFDVGYDYISYYNVITDLNSKNYERFGLIDQIIIDIARFLDFYQFYFITTSFIIIYLILKTIKMYSENYFFSILIFLSIPIFYLMSFTIIRQYVAISIIFFSIKYIFNRNIIKYMILIFIASIFHITALIAFPLYFAYKVRFTKKISLLIILFSFYIASLIPNILEIYFPYYYFYVSENANSGKSLLYFFLLIFFFILFHYKYIKDEKSCFYYNTYVIGVALYCLLIQLGEVAPRVSYYYLIFLILLIPSTIKFYKIKQAYFIILIMTILLYSFNFYLFNKNENKNPYIPYNTFININEKTYIWR